MNQLVRNVNVKLSCRYSHVLQLDAPCIYKIMGVKNKICHNNKVENVFMWHSNLQALRTDAK